MDEILTDPEGLKDTSDYQIEFTPKEKENVLGAIAELLAEENNLPLQESGKIVRKLPISHLNVEKRANDLTL